MNQDRPFDLPVQNWLSSWKRTRLRRGSSEFRSILLAQIEIHVSVSTTSDNVRSVVYGACFAFGCRLAPGLAQLTALVHVPVLRHLADHLLRLPDNFVQSCRLALRQILATANGNTTCAKISPATTLNLERQTYLRERVPRRADDRPG